MNFKEIWRSKNASRFFQSRMSLIMFSLIIFQHYSCGDDGGSVQEACQKIISKMEKCLPDIKKVKCSGYSNCTVYLKSDAQQNCEKNLKMYSDSDINLAVSQIESWSCTELAQAVSPYIEMQYALTYKSEGDEKIIDQILKESSLWLQVKFNLN
jgi:hypothetical protein